MGRILDRLEVAISELSLQSNKNSKGFPIRLGLGESSELCRERGHWKPPASFTAPIQGRLLHMQGTLILVPRSADAVVILELS